MIVYTPVKINLGLNIRYKREDGYHEIDSVFYPVKWFDALEIEKIDKEGIYSSFSGLAIPGKKEDNLIEKAINLISGDFNISGVQYHLDKSIPMGAGLGGGSSNAASTIKLVDSIFNLKMTFEQQMSYAAKLGSDINFFLYDQACRCSGRGEIVKPISLSLKGKYIYIINPSIHVSTSDAFSEVKKEDKLLDVDRMIQTEVKEWRCFVKNDFESSVFKKYPEIESIKSLFYDCGAEYASMTGSGSSVYGIFNQPVDINHNYDSYFFGILD